MHGSFEPHGLVKSGNNFQYDSVRTSVYQTADSSLFNISSFDILETTNCKIMSICDSLKLTGPPEICLKANDTIRYSVHKNPQCLKEVEWNIDTSYADLIKTNTDTTIALRFKKEGQCKLFIGLKGCSLKDSIVISISTPKIGLSITADTLLCPGNNTVLYGTKGFTNYTWSNGSTDDSMITGSAGLYKLTSADNCGNISKDSIYIKLIDTSISLKSTQVICLTDTVTIQVPRLLSDITWQPNYNAHWQNNSLKFFPDRNTRYRIIFFFNRNCPIQKNIEVKAEKCPETIFFPNSFTPNNDGLNDVFRPSVSRPLAFYHLTIYNRYGQIVFESSNPFAGWDGRLQGSGQNNGAFIWQ